MSSLPLDGIRIADFGTVITGPWATHLLATMGAEVIKVESMRRPDGLRTLPIWADGIPGVNRSIFNVYNCSKKSCTIDLSRSEGAELARALVKISDVVVECFGFGVMERLGLGYAMLKELKPDIIMLSISGPGRTGPEKEYLCYGHTIHAYCGLTGLTGYLHGPPTGLGTTYTDPLTGLAGTFAMLTALYHRANTGEGQYIDLSMSEITMAQLPEAIMDYTMNQRERGRQGNRDDIMAPHNCYPCKGEDKWVAISVSNDEEWKAFCAAIGSPEWTRDEQFSDQYSRWQNQDELDRLVGEWTRNYTSYEVMEILQKAGVAAGPSLNSDEIVTDPHLNERDFFVALDHPEVGKRVLTGRPWKLSAIPKANYHCAPLFGEHNDYVFGELLGLSKDKIAELVKEKVIY